MKGISRRIILIITCIFFIALTRDAKADANESAPLLYVFTEYSPANYLDEDGNPTGFFVEIVLEALQHRMGIPVDIKVYPWPRCQSMVENACADMITTVPTAERLAYCDKVDTPIWVKRYQIYTWADNPKKSLMDGIDSVSALKASGLSVLSYLGNSWSETTLKKSGSPVINANSVEGMYRMLYARRGDIVIDDPVLVDPALAAMGMVGNVVPTRGVVEESLFHPLIGKASTYAGIVPEFGRVLENMRKDGTIDRIMENYRTK